MATDRRDDLRAFRDFVDKQLGNGGAGLTLEECIGLWDIENQSDQERDETLAAVHQGLEDMRTGRVRPFEEFDREFRMTHNLPPRS